MKRPSFPAPWLLAAVLALPAAGPALAHSMACGKAAGIDRLRCERHEKMAAHCGALAGELHHACDREFLIANPLDCRGLPSAEGVRCEAERAAFKACDAKAGREFVVCVRQTTNDSPLGVH